MTNRHRRGARLAGATATVLLVAGLAAPASAADPMTAYLDCASDGGGFFHCELAISGGTPAYSVQWTGAISYREQTGGWSYVTGSCTVGRSAAVQVAVTDSNGQQTATSTGFFCYKWAA